MESPVRICLGAALVLNLLLLSRTVNSNALPEATTTTLTTTIKDLRSPRISRNSTWASRKQKPPDVALNELHPKESVSEDHTEKNAKYKDRGRVRFSAQTKATQGPIRRVKNTTHSSTTQASKANLIIVTPTPEVKRPAQIIDSMRTYKKTKMPISSSTTSIPATVETEKNEEEEYEEEGEEEEKESLEKYTSKFDSNFFTIPSYNSDFHSDSEGSDNKVKSDFSSDYSKSPYGTFSSYFPEVSSYDSSANKNDHRYESESFFDFNSELTTPKNDFFDKKYEQISKSIIKNLDSIKKNTPPPTTKDNIVKIVKENIGLEKSNKEKPSNKSTVIIKNTKEIRLLDNEGAGNIANKALSDVHGTSIYYEMSVLSTETYNIDSGNDDDCDNDGLPDPTIGTSSEQELASIKATQPTPSDTSRTVRGSQSESITTLSSNFLPFSSLDPIQFSSISPVSYSTAGPVSFSTQNSVISSTEKTIRAFSNSYSRNRNYSKRLSSSSGRDSPSNANKVEFSTHSSIIRIPSRKFHHTTPKIKPVWMAPRRNITRNYARSTTPTTIYSEYFNIKDKLTTPEPKELTKSTLTTVSSDIDPVLQSDVSGVKRVVHSQSITDNSIPTLWKRGSTRYGTHTSTAASIEDESGVSDLEIPPTLTAWALASLRSPPTQSLSNSVNATSTTSTQKTIDENELQSVGNGEQNVTKDTSTSTTTTTSINNDIIPVKVTEVDQNRLSWRPAQPIKPETTTDPKETKSELSAESNISIKSSAQPSTTEAMKVQPLETTAKTVIKHSWVSATETTTEELEKETIPPVDATKSTGFESITKLPNGLTTPHDDTVKTEPTTDVPTTTDYEITTIRFSYVPTETKEENTTWHPVFPTRTKTTIKDEPITTYRPQYSTTEKDETETVIPETTPTDTLEVSTEKALKEEQTTETLTTLQPTTFKEVTTAEMETVTMIVEVVTEINTEREVPKSGRETTSTEISMQTETSSSETETPPSEIRESSSEENSRSNEVITQETKVTSPATTTHESTKLATKTTEITESTTQTEPEVTVTKEETTTVEATSEIPMYVTTRVEDITTYSDMTTYSDVTTEASSQVLTDVAGSGAAVAIAVSTIGVIALILLVGLLLVVRRRGRRGVYAQRCTPVSLDAYSLDSVSVGHRKGNHRLRASKRSYGNPAYDDEVTSHPMQYAALANFALDIESMTTEFAEIPSVTVRPDEVPSGCEDKNRYSNVLPLPETRVPLKRIGNDPTTEYINANFITGPGNIKNYYIAAQAPLHNTVGDFWRMIWEQNSRVIVMLTEYMENGVEKCYEYLPPSEISDNKRTFAEFQIILTKREQSNKYAISTVQLINLTTRTWREVTHLWYFWPAKGVPDDYDSVLDFLSEMRSYMKISQTAKEYDEEGVEIIYGDSNRSSFQSLSKLREEGNSGNGVNVYSPSKAEELMRRNGNNGTLGRMKVASEVEGVRPCVVVCASGAGRSAAIIAADICARALAVSAADVPRVVREIRAQRPHSMANRHHYIFLYKLLSEYGNKLMGGGVDTI